MSLMLVQQDVTKRVLLQTAVVQTENVSGQCGCKLCIPAVVALEPRNDVNILAVRGLNLSFQQSAHCSLVLAVRNCRDIWQQLLLNSCNKKLCDLLSVDSTTPAGRSMDYHQCMIYLLSYVVGWGAGNRIDRQSILISK